MTPALRALLRGDLREAQRIATADDHIAILAATRSAKLARLLLDDQVGLSSSAVIAFAAAVAGDRVRALSRLTPDAFHGDDAQLACEAVIVLGERSLVSQALATVDYVQPREDLRPIATLRGELLLFADGIDELGRVDQLPHVDDAVRSVEEGLTLARSQAAVPFIADAARVLARALDARGSVGDRDRAVLLSAQAHELWHRCSVEL